ncbi:DUF3078 domain-containing protein [Croceimicrobium sp.]|uniref:DUF3078 domain-containing protein n=1 Tax=Croceimicrobium sp. TaxID=2828340 RepID=UPI003BAD8A91
MPKAALLIISLLSLSLQAQNNALVKEKDVLEFRKLSIQRLGQDALDTTKWDLGGNFGIQFTQASYSNWQAGGVNSIAGNSIFNGFANYIGKGKWVWSNAMTLAYGVNFQDTIFNKTDDRIEIESRLDYLHSKKWSYSALANFRTQFRPGYENPGDIGDDVKISDFMAPGYLLFGLGATNKPNKRFTMFLSPITAKATFVTVERLANMGAYGVDSGSSYRLEAGAYANITYKRKLWKNVDLQGRIDLFSNYVEDPSLIDINSELIMFFKVNKYIKANVSLAYIYDHDVKFDLDEDPLTPGVPRSQFKQVLSIGFSYDFGAAAKDE